jgi:hypothetical protein
MAEQKSGVRLRLEPDDEYMHPVEAAENFNESMYFNVFDRAHRIGGWFRIGNRPNEGRGEMSCCVYLPDGRIGFMFARPECRKDDAFDAAGMRFEVVEPFKQLRVTYRGKLCLLANPQDMADPSTAFRNNPIVRAEIDLDYEGISPMFGGERVNEDGSRIEERAEAAFARGHYEQHIAGKGEIRIEGRTFPIDGLGLRDHSWGPRYWQNIYWYRWLPMNFTRDFAMMISIICRGDGALRCGGVVLRDGEYVVVRDARIEAAYDENQCQTSMKVWARTDERDYEVTGKVMSLIPLRNRRQAPDGEQLMTRITEGMTEFRCDGHVGYGLSEFLDQIVDGDPVGLKAGS